MTEFSERQKKACQSLLEAGFDKAMVGNPMTIGYLTGCHITPYERFYGLYIDANEEKLKMVVPGVNKGSMKGRVPEVTYLDATGPFEEIKKVVGNCNSLAVETNYYSMKTGNMFYDLGCQVKDIGNCIEKLRMKKDKAEIEKMQFAADIVDNAIAYVKDKIYVGMTEIELQRMLFNYMATYKGFNTDEVIILVLGADNSANPHGVSGDYIFKKGDIILMDFCAYYNSYWSDITRCLFLGEIGNPKLKEIYEIVLCANLEAISKVKPGIPAKEIDKTARDIITEAGYGELFLHRTGHGLGLSIHEEPMITGVNELILEEGMTFTIEPGIYIEGVGGVRIEDDILVTSDGCITLTKTSKKLEDQIVEIADKGE